MEQALFYVLALIALGAALVVVAQRNPMYSAFALIVTLCALSGIFGLLGSPFIAVLQIIVYAGAIMVLFLFAVMLLGRGPGHSLGLSGRARGWIGPALLAALLLAELLTLLGGATSAGPATGPVNPRAVGLSLFGPYLLAVELASMLLLAGVVGAWHLGRSLPARQSKQP
jgi:NADH-quinone oxidoreductase subunit J